MIYAEVAVNAPLAHPRTFTYSIPSDIPVSVGYAVWAPFGPRLLQGIVFALSDYSPVPETKDIDQVIGTRPLLSYPQVELARWIAEHYVVSYFDAASLMLPPGFERKVLTFVEPNPRVPEYVFDSLPPQQQEIMTFLQEKGRTNVKDVPRIAGKGKIDSAITQLVRRKLVLKTCGIEPPKIHPRLVTYLKLAVSTDQAREAITGMEVKRAHRQSDLLQLLMGAIDPVSLPEARRELGFSSATVQALQKRGLISLDRVSVRRDPLAHRTFAAVNPPTLTRDQNEVFDAIRTAMQEHGSATTFLLHGVTGSGKTEIYLRALKEAVAQGKRAIVLVPEIALTPQIIARFAERFPARVAVLHSKLTPGEQFDEWHRIRDGNFDVVIGSRGALFAPQPDMGLIIIDEEHEWTYKQHDQQPRYHARDAAIKLAELTNAVLIMGSATPDITSYYRAQHGEHRLLQLPQRIAGGEISQMPLVEIVDLRRELREGNRSILSRSLYGSISRALAAREQVILFLNRRGTATFVQCRDCGFVMRCKRCDVSLTYHAAEDGLMCHQCNYRSRIPGICPDCSSKRIKYLGIGTQKVEEEVSAIFPGARTLRWDRDVTKGRYAHEEILERFLSHDADILIGTQMIAKGLDIPLVTIVGVINADIGLHLPDFRSSERTFQILAQVAGRAGRGTIPGKVIIQSYTPWHYAVTTASNHDYSSFYEQELHFRQQQNHPPFSRMARLVYTNTNAARCQSESQRFCRILRQEITSRGIPHTRLIGPSPAFTPRVRGKFRWHIIVCGPDPVSLFSEITIPIGWSLDIDPLNLN